MNLISITHQIRRLLSESEVVWKSTRQEVKVQHEHKTQHVGPTLNFQTFPKPPWVGRAFLHLATQVFPPNFLGLSLGCHSWRKTLLLPWGAKFWKWPETTGRWWFHMCFLYFHSLSLGKEDPIWGVYVSNGLVQPPPRKDLVFELNLSYIRHGWWVPKSCFMRSSWDSSGVSKDI